MGGDTDGVLRNSDGDPNLLNANRNDDGRWLNTSYDNPDNRWNRENGFAFVLSQLSSFLHRLNGGGVLFYDLTTPPTKHFSCIFKLNRQCNIFFIIQRLSFPKHHK